MSLHFPRAPSPESRSPLRIGGVILAGGKSTRMGRPKADLPFGPESMLQRVARLLASAVSPLVIVAAEGQSLSELPEDCLIALDRRPERGPLEGLAAGLAAIAPHADAAYATACDAPLLVPAFVRLLATQLADYDAVVPMEGDFHHPLAAIYRTSVLPHIERLLAQDRLRPTDLFNEIRTRRIDVAELRAVDPELRTLRNVNRPEDYVEALAAAGF